MDNPALFAADAIFQRQAATGATASTIAASVVSTWRQVEQALTPVLGVRGVAALFRRAVFLSKDRFPWLDEVFLALDGREDLSAVDVFGVVLGQQRADNAAAGGDAFFHTFHALLISMIGSSLTDRLLQSALANFSSGPSAQDISS
jgi:hypothetical protein